MLQQFSDEPMAFQLPEETASLTEFTTRLNDAWVVCDHFDLQTAIWRGRILRAVRDREKLSGDLGFINWLKDQEITKSQAYSLIELADSADRFIIEGVMPTEAFSKFSKKAFVEAAKSSREVMTLVAETAQNGDRITYQTVKQLSDEWAVASSELLPDEVKSGSIPTRILSPLAKDLGKLPELHVKAIQEEVAAMPDVETVKDAAKDAKYLAKYLDAVAQVQSIDESTTDVEKALEEALRLGCLNTAADVVKQAAQIEHLAVKLHSAWKKLSDTADRLYVDTGASSPNLRSLLSNLDNLTKPSIEVKTNDEGDSIRLQIL